MPCATGGGGSVFRLNLRTKGLPKNIIMIGPTGVGKTEIARRLARLANAPFLKIEASKFTEVGYVGRDVESIIRDLMEIAINMVKTEHMAKVQEKAMALAEAAFPLSYVGYTTLRNGWPPSVPASVSQEMLFRLQGLNLNAPPTILLFGKHLLYLVSIHIGAKLICS